MTEQTIDQLVQERIKAIFSEIAEMVGNGQVPHVTEDEAAGIPLGLFRAEQALLGAWRCVVEPAHIDDGMLWNLTQEFHTADPYQLLTELHEARSMLLSDNADLRADRDRMCTERDATDAQLIAARRERDETVSELEAELDAMRAERDAARADVTRLQEAVEFTGEAAGRAAAERDEARKDRQRLIDLIEDYACLTSRAIAARNRLKRAALRLYHKRNDARAWAAAWKRAAKGWREAAHEAQAVQFRYRDADVGALVEAATWARDAVEAYHVLGMMDRPSDAELLGVLRAALRPFRRTFKVPMYGTIGETAEEWEALRARVMTAEAIDAARPDGMDTP